MNRSKYITFYLITPDEEDVFFGQSSKDKRDMTLEEYSSALVHVKDNEIYPEIPKDAALTVAPDSLDDSSAFIKRSGLVHYEVFKGTDFILKEISNESLIMEKASKLHHPNLVKYHGYRVRRGRITGIVLERLDQTLTQYALELSTSGASWDLDLDKFITALESAIDELHSLGLAHNDIDPHNIMVKNGLPVLIDFGSCQPFGEHLQSLGTPGWCEEPFYTSEQKHDWYSIGKLREWFQNYRNDQVKAGN